LDAKGEKHILTCAQQLAHNDTCFVVFSDDLAARRRALRVLSSGLDLVKPCMRDVWFLSLLSLDLIQFDIKYDLFQCDITHDLMQCDITHDSCVTLHMTLAMCFLVHGPVRVPNQICGH